jgi:hypothetical protein
MERIFLYVPPEEYAEVKASGACWDDDSKRWYIRSDMGPAKVASPITVRTAGRCRRIIFCMLSQVTYSSASCVRNPGRSSSRRCLVGFS